jgi:hypothetical protein
MHSGRVRLRQNPGSSATGERTTEVYTFGQMAPLVLTTPQAIGPSHHRLDGLGLPNDPASPCGSSSTSGNHHAQLLPASIPVLQMDTDLDELLTKGQSSISRPSTNDDSKDESPPQFCITAPSEVKDGVECTRGVELMLVEPNSDDASWSLDSSDTIFSTSGNFISPTQRVHTTDPRVKHPPSASSGLVDDCLYVTRMPLIDQTIL